MEIANEILINIAPEFLWLFLAVILTIFLVMSFILQHHWKYYGIKGNSKVFARALFWIISVFLIFTMLLSILFFENI